MDVNLINQIAKELLEMGAKPVSFYAQAERIAGLVEDSDWLRDKISEAVYMESFYSYYIGNAEE